MGRHGGSGAAAKGSHVPGDEVGVSHDHGDGVEGDAKFFGDGLGKGSADVLADFDLAGEDFDAAVGVDVDPGADVGGKFVAVRGAAGLLRREVGSEAEEEAAAEELQEVAAIDGGAGAKAPLHLRRLFGTTKVVP